MPCLGRSASSSRREAPASRCPPGSSCFLPLPPPSAPGHRKPRASGSLQDSIAKQELRDEQRDRHPAVLGLPAQRRTGLPLSGAPIWLISAFRLRDVRGSRFPAHPFGESRPSGSEAHGFCRLRHFCARPRPVPVRPQNRGGGAPTLHVADEVGSCPNVYDSPSLPGSRGRSRASLAVRACRPSRHCRTP